MKEFSGKVAVVTGAASGIGRAIADRCARENMKVVLADVEKEPLFRTKDAMQRAGATVRAVLTDVSKAGDVEALADEALNTFGEVNLLFNNAGVVGALTSIWESPIADWEWVLGVNLWGVIHGIRVFVPLMVDQGSECHIVNTSSLSGVTSGPGLGVYKVSKHGVVTLSETLYNELNRKGAKIGVSVLCPYWVSTNIVDSDRNRPSPLQADSAGHTERKREKKSHQEIRHAVETGMPPGEIAEKVFDAIREEKFYIFTHPESAPLIRLRMEDMLEGRNPTNPLQ